MPLSKEEIASLESTHKRVAHIIGRNGAWEVVLRKPTRAEYKRFRSMLHNDAQKADATESLARTCVVYPSREAFDSMLDEYPAIGDAAGGVLGELVGFTADQMGK